ncbi:putative cbp4 domain-containing protein [Phaeoacremonium minimum UCRPA7]|uniref:Cytochrome b mRNA-processing protein 4 n=1 Tax=Phaeoacremonium minimum (strain UCR-PA7) TaxID=1286976 RepID=R8BQR4_PHAM7|nr:putative cbp4 domain-containing protein [Phaeoacremonium minimum UCRPA7]EOO01625.1 putative cbp4 domain-containing protein [Phaeoacremonium minimum UCRPA7]
MAPKPTNWGRWLKMLGGGALVCVGGPALTMYLAPTDEELFQKYNPDLQRKSLEKRVERQQEFDDFVNRLKKYSKSSKPIWVVQKEDEERQRQAKLQESLKIADEVKARREAMRKEAGLSPESTR